MILPPPPSAVEETEPWLAAEGSLPLHERITLAPKAADAPPPFSVFVPMAADTMESPAPRPAASGSAPMSWADVDNEFAQAMVARAAKKSKIGKSRRAKEKAAPPISGVQGPPDVLKRSG